MEPRPGRWARLEPLPKALLILAVPLFLLCGVVTVVAAANDESRDEPPSAGLREPARSAPASLSPRIVTRTVTETEEIPYDEETVEDPSLPEGTEEVRTEGVPGELTVTYEVTLTNGVETDRRRVSEEVTLEPVDEVTVIGTMQPQPEPEPESESDDSGCHPSYSGVCVPTGVSDVDCGGGSGNGPAYVYGPVYVDGPDVYDLDRDGDGVACE
jgi:resuscitation-promoting factor RpfB